MKLRILCNRPGPPNVMPDSPQWSWAVRELGAEIKYYCCGTPLDQLCDGCDVAAYAAEVGVPDIETLKRGSQKCRLVGLFLDAGCPYGYKQLQQYADENVFHASVNCCGGDWPHRPGIDFTYFGFFDPKPYEKSLPRTRKLGFNGAWAPERGGLVQALGKDIDYTFDVRYEIVRPYQIYADWMLSTRAVVNTCWTTHCLKKTMKGRANEAALAGCLLFDLQGGRLSDYFTPGEDYLEYTDHLQKVIDEVPPEARPHAAAYFMKHAAEEIREVLRRPDFDEYAEAMGQRFKTKMLSKYGPERFWNKVMYGDVT